MFVFFCMTLPQYLQIKKSAQWPSVPGVITRSYLRSGFCLISMPCYHGEVAYSYRVGSTDYQSTSIDLGRSPWAAKDGWQRVLDHYPVGKTVRVYYEPARPAHAVLNSGLVGEMEGGYKLNLFLIGGSAFAFLICLLLYDDGE